MNKPLKSDTFSTNPHRQAVRNLYSQDEASIIDLLRTKITLTEAERAEIAQAGAILPLVTDPISPASYILERHLCIDTTAAGGNASLLATTY